VGGWRFGRIAIYTVAGEWQAIELKESLREDELGFGEIYFSPGDFGPAGFNPGDSIPGGYVWLTVLKACGFEAVCVDGLAFFTGDYWQRFTTADSGLANDWIFDIAFDPSGDLWLATAAGLQRMPAP
jgi:hypothetical protein